MRAGDLVGDYRIVRPLGEGGMATVFVAMDERHEREVVLKALPPYLNSPEMEARFRREIQAIASLSHPNVVKVLDHAVTSTLAWYVMPFLPAEDLEKHVRGLRGQAATPPPSTFGRLRGILADVASALAHCHERGVFHRDIKPQNILVETGSRRGILSDFGLARAADMTNITKSRQMVGTLRYLSPEMMGEGDVGAPSDVYQLALVVYEVFAGQLPFTCANPYDELKRRHSEPIPSMRTFHPQVSEELSELVVRALAVEPEKRPESMQRFHEELAAVALDHRGVRTGAIPRTVTLAISKSQELSASLALAERRRRVVVRAAAIFSAVVLAVLGVQRLLRGDEPRGFEIKPGYQSARVHASAGPRFRVEISGPRTGTRAFDAQPDREGWSAPVEGLAPGQCYTACWVLEDGRRGAPVEFCARDIAVAQLRSEIAAGRLKLGFETSRPVRAKLLAADDTPVLDLDTSPALQHTGEVAVRTLGGPDLRVALFDADGDRAVLELGPIALPEDVAAETVAALRALDLDRVFREVSSTRWRKEQRARLAAHLGDGLLRRVMGALEAFRPIAPLYFASSGVPLARRVETYAAVGKLYHVEGIFAREGIPVAFDIPGLLGPLAPSPATSLSGATALAVELMHDEHFRANQIADLRKLSSDAYDVAETGFMRPSATVERDIRNVRELKKAELVMQIAECLRDVYFWVEINGRCRLLFFPPGFAKVVKSGPPVVMHHPFDPALLEDGRNRFRVEVHAVADFPYTKADGHVGLLELRAQ